jgi:hypothetical protein
MCEDVGRVEVEKMKSCAGRIPTTKCRWRRSEVDNFSVIARDEPPMRLRNVAVGLSPQASARATCIEHFQRHMVITAAASQNAASRPGDEATTVIYTSTISRAVLPLGVFDRPMPKITYAMRRQMGSIVNASAYALETGGTGTRSSCISSHLM